MMKPQPMRVSHKRRKSIESASRAKVIEDTGITALPQAPDGKHATYLEVKPFMINRFSTSIEDAWKVLQFLTSKDVMAEWAWVSGFVPPRKDVAETERFKKSRWHQGFLRELPYGRALEPINWAPVITAILDGMQAVIYKTQTPSEAGGWLYDRLSSIARQGIL